MRQRMSADARKLIVHIIGRVTSMQVHAAAVHCSVQVSTVGCNHRDQVCNPPSAYYLLLPLYVLKVYSRSYQVVRLLDQLMCFGLLTDHLQQILGMLCNATSCFRLSFLRSNRICTYTLPVDKRSGLRPHKPVSNGQNHRAYCRSGCTIEPVMEVCCAAGAPVSVDYSPKGKYEQIGDMRVYVTGEGSSKAIIPVYDIFGFSNQFLQVCDRLAAAGYIVAAPDFFRDKPWSLDKFPPKPEDNLQGWIQSYPWAEKVQPDVYAVVNYLKASKSVSTFGTVGFCWGAVMSVQAVQDPAVFKAAALLHPSLFGKEKELCAAAKAPLAVASAQGDPYESIQEAMQGHEFAAQCVYRQYNNMIHGFCGARGKFEDPEVVKAVGEVIALLTDFFGKNLH